MCSPKPGRTTARAPSPRRPQASPELAYFVLFLPMLLVLIFRPQGLFGRHIL